MKTHRFTRQTYLLCIIAGCYAGALHADVPSDWQVFSGVASISEYESVSGITSLRLEAGEPPAEVATLLPTADTDTRIEVSLWVLPVADASGNPLSSINVLGAKAGFLLDDNEGRIYAFDRNHPRDTGGRFDVFPTGEATEWIHLQFLLESTPDHGVLWALWIDGERSMAGDSSIRIGTNQQRRWNSEPS